MNNTFELHTERLVLRPVGDSDAPSVFKYRSDKITNQYQGWIPETVEDVSAFIQKTAREVDIVDTWFQLVIIRIDTDEIIGDIGIHFMDPINKQVEIGCTLAKDQQGKGYATEGLKKVIDFLFTDLDKHRIIGSIDPENSQSIALVERLGFRKEAHFRKSLFLNGQWVDDIVYARLAMPEDQAECR